MTKQPDKDWRQQVIDMLPRMEANAGTEPAGFTPATPADFGPTTFHGNRTPNDPADLLDGLPLVKMTSIHQRALDQLAQIPTHEQVQEKRLEALGYKNRIVDLTRHKSEGGFGLDAAAPQVVAERRKLERAEKELAWLTTLKEDRTARWNALSRLDQTNSDWVLRGIPGDCVIETVEDQPLEELLKKGETIASGVERYRHRQRELAADAHRVNSQQWPISVSEADARALIERRGEAGRPDLEAAIENGRPIGFATTRLTALVHNAQPGAVAFAETEDAVGLVCWLFGKELLEKIRAGFREIGDDKNALDQRQREEMLATISADSLAAERAECALIWHADARGEVIDLRPTTSPQAALGVALRTVPRAVAPGTTGGHAYDLVQPGGRR
jgi:hypothetical protein